MYNFLSQNGNYISGSDVQEFANVLDFVVVSTSFLLLIISRTSSGFRFDNVDDSFRIVMTFPILRLFTQVESMLNSVYTIIVIMPQFTNLFILFIMTFYVFAVYGILLFKGEFAILHDEAPKSNFDDLASSFFSEFQLFVGQDWSDYLCRFPIKSFKFKYVTLDAAVKVKGSYFYAMFFIVFILIVTILISNVVIALVLTISQKISGIKNVSQFQINQKILEED